MPSVLLILGAFAINFAWIDLSRTRVIIAAYAATHATGRTCSLTGSLAHAKAKANTAASMKLVVGNAMTLVDADFTRGTSTRSSTSIRCSFTTVGSHLPADVVSAGIWMGAISHDSAGALVDYRASTIFLSSISVHQENVDSFLWRRSVGS